MKATSVQGGGAQKAATSKPAPAASSVPYIPQKGTITKNYASYSEIPAIYRRKPLSQAEMDMVPVRPHFLLPFSSRFFSITCIILTYGLCGDKNCRLGFEKTAYWANTGKLNERPAGRRFQL